MNKKKQILIITIFLILAAGIFLVYNLFGKEDKKDQKKTKAVTEESEKKGTGDPVERPYRYQYDNLGKLYFLDEAKLTKWKNALEEWIEADGQIISRIQVEQEPKQERDSWIWYLTLQGAVRTITAETRYDGSTFTFQKRDLPEDEPKESDVDEAGNPRQEITDYDAGDEDVDVGRVKITNPDVLPENVDVAKLQSDLTAYLEKEGEFRRNLTIDEETAKKKTGPPAIFLCRFDIPRTDRKSVKAAWTDRNTWYFTME